MSKQIKQQWVTILGSTGSIGTSTLDVISSNPELYRVFALTANDNVDMLFTQCKQWQPRFAVMADDKSAVTLALRLREAGIQTEVLAGEQSLIDIAKYEQVDIVVAAIVGAAGLMPTLCAVQAGKRVLLANKESLVMAGALFMNAVKKHQAALLPVDSEHNAILQCMPQGYLPGHPIASSIKSICLTASGGPFREWPLSAMKNITIEQALAHPNWKMGPKVTIDSATLFNKGLEIAEAHWLFGMPINQIEAIIHPQSVIHSMVKYRDGSVLAQMGLPDMRTPIATSLAWPDRIESNVAELDFLSMNALTFEPVDLQRFPCLRIVFEALRQGGSSMVIVNAANEIAVAAFLQGQIGFLKIAHIVEQVLCKISNESLSHIDQVLDIDRQSREIATQLVKKNRLVAV